MPINAIKNDTKMVALPATISTPDDESCRNKIVSAATARSNSEADQ
jgi:hypothetical protein